MGYRIVLIGRVQGVGCRYYCANVGRQLGVHGSATNMDDGTVVVFLETNNTEKAHSFANALQHNSLHFSFYGHIRHLDIFRTDETMTGDYEW